MHRSNSAQALAKTLGISVNTLKDLCRRGVFPAELTYRTAGGQWRVAKANLPDLHARLRLWRFWHRKALRRVSRTVDYHPRGHCCTVATLDESCYWLVECGEHVFRSRREETWNHLRGRWVLQRREGDSIVRSHDRQEELEKLAFELLQLHESSPGFILSVAHCAAWSEELKRTTRQGFARTVTTADSIISLLASRTTKELGVLFLQVRVARLRQERGRRAITVKELAERMDMGVATLYRIYGRGMLRRVLSPETNDHLPASEDEGAVARDAKASGSFRYHSERDTEQFWDDASDGEQSSSSGTTERLRDRVGGH